jgi:hypothetical protein
VRLAYLDEAGISNRTHEPYMVVAGKILNADEPPLGSGLLLSSLLRSGLLHSDARALFCHPASAI